MPELRDHDTIASPAKAAGLDPTLFVSVVKELLGAAASLRKEADADGNKAAPDLAAVWQRALEEAGKKTAGSAARTAAGLPGAADSGSLATAPADFQSQLSQLLDVFARMTEAGQAIGNALEVAQQSLSGSRGQTAPEIGHLPHLAGGGVVDRPTLAVIGEKGPEAVVPTATLETSVKDAYERLYGSSKQPMKAGERKALETRYKADLAEMLARRQAGSARGDSPAAVPPDTPAPVLPEHLELLRAAVGRHGGAHNLAALDRVRAHLAENKIAARAHQDAIIHAGRAAGLVAGANSEGGQRQGQKPSQEFLAAQLPSDEAGGARIGFLSLRPAEPAQQAQHLATGGVVKQAPSLPSFLGTPGPQAPAPPPHWQPEFMQMAPSQAMRQVTNRLTQQGMAPQQAHGIGAAIASYVNDWSTHPPIVYNRVLANAYNRTGDQEGAMATARSASERARQLKPGAASVKHLATGGVVDGSGSGPGQPDREGPFVPEGTDTVPAMLTPGERVINKHDSEAHAAELNAIQGHKTVEAGGKVQYLASGTGSTPSTDATSFELLEQAAQDAGSAASLLGKSLPSLAEIISKALADLQARITAQGGPQGRQGTVLAQLQASTPAGMNQPHQAHILGLAQTSKDAQGFLQKTGLDMAGAATRAGKALPQIGDVLDTALANLKAKIAKQGGPEGNQAAVLQHLQAVKSGQTALAPEEKAGIKSATEAGANDPLNKLMGSMRKASEGVKELVGSLGKMTGGAAAAFVPLAAGMGSLAHAANPALFQTLTQSMTLFGASLGSVVVGPVLTLSFKLQDLARWFQTIDPSVKAQIGTWLGWAAGITGAGMVASRLMGIVSSLLPVIGGLKAALVFTVANPFGMLLAGLGALAAVKLGGMGFGDMTKGVSGAVASITAALDPLMTAGSKIFTALADAAGVMLLPALKGLGAGLLWLGGVVEGIAGYFNTSSGNVVALGAAFTMLLGPSRLVVGAVISLISWIGSLSTSTTVARGGFAGMTGAMGGAAAASRGFAAALASTGIGLLVVGISAAVTALLSMSGAFGGVADQAARATAKIAEQKAMLDQLQNGGKATATELEKQLTPEEHAEYKSAKTEDERKKLVKDFRQRAEGQAAAMPMEQGEKVAANVRAELDKVKDVSMWQSIGAKTEIRREAIEKGLVKTGYTPENAKAVSGDMAKTDFSALGKTKLSESDIKDYVGLKFAGTPTDFAAKAAFLKRLEDQGGTAGSGSGEDLDPRLRELRKLQTQRGLVAYPKEMQAQQMDAGQVRGTIQNLGLNTSPLEALILKVQRENWMQIEQQIVTKMKDIADNTRPLRP